MSLKPTASDSITVVQAVVFLQCLLVLRVKQYYILELIIR